VGALFKRVERCLLRQGETLRSEGRWAVWVSKTGTMPSFPQPKSQDQEITLFVVPAMNTKAFRCVWLEGRLHPLGKQFSISQMSASLFIVHSSRFLSIMPDKPPCCSYFLALEAMFLSFLSPEIPFLAAFLFSVLLAFLVVGDVQFRKLVAEGSQAVQKLG
jgi:hypothetical protein